MADGLFPLPEGERVRVRGGLCREKNVTVSTHPFFSGRVTCATLSRLLRKKSGTGCATNSSVSRFAASIPLIVSSLTSIARAKLCIEIDGDAHAEPDQAEYDAARTAWLEARGYRVVRFHNDGVHHNLSAMVDAIRAACVLVPEATPGEPS